jgi:hypothetical protein
VEGFLIRQSTNNKIKKELQQTVIMTTWQYEIGEMQNIAKLQIKFSLAFSNFVTIRHT